MSSEQPFNRYEESRAEGPVGTYKSLRCIADPVQLGPLLAASREEGSAQFVFLADSFPASVGMFRMYLLTRGQAESPLGIISCTKSSSYPGLDCRASTRRRRGTSHPRSFRTVAEPLAVRPPLSATEMPIAARPGVLIPRLMASVRFSIRPLSRMSNDGSDP